MNNNINWEKEREQSSQQVKDNKLVQAMFKTLFDLSKENKELKTHLDNLRDINRTNKTEPPANSKEEVEKAIKTEKLRRIRDAVSTKEHLETYQGKAICGFCKEAMSGKWSQRLIYYICDPVCSQQFEKLIFRSIWEHWEK